MSSVSFNYLELEWETDKSAQPIVIKHNLLRNENIKTTTQAVSKL